MKESEIRNPKCGRWAFDVGRSFGLCFVLLALSVSPALAGVTTRVSVASGGEQANPWSGGPSISADGRYVAFTSHASNLVTGDTNGRQDVFARDRQTGVTERVSVSSDGTQANSSSEYPSISADGRYVAFCSYASNLVSWDTNGYYDVFLHDRHTSVTERVSVSSGGTQANWESYWPSVSAGGRYVAFYSYAASLVRGDTNETYDVFVRDRQTGETERVSVSSEGTQGNYGSSYPSISGDGRYVAFHSSAFNLVPGDTNIAPDIFVRDRYTIADTKASSDGTDAVLSGNAVTASLAGCFYAEDADRSGGIKVSWSGAVIEGDRYRVDGTLDTDENGERYISATNVRRIDTLPVAPLGMAAGFLGGRDTGYDPETGAGQQGITGGFGVNNIGLLIRAWGRVTQKGSGYLYIDDGCGLRDGTVTGSEENIGVRVICDPSAYNTGDFLEVTGISSCFQTPSGLGRRILTRRIAP